MNTQGEPGWYEIRLRGRLDERWASWFDGLSVEPAPGGVTVLRGPLADQAALHGVLARLRDVGVPLISVAPYPSPARSPDADHPDHPDHPDRNSRDGA